MVGTATCGSPVHQNRRQFEMEQLHTSRHGVCCAPCWARLSSSPNSGCVANEWRVCVCGNKRRSRVLASLVVLACICDRRGSGDIWGPPAKTSPDKKETACAFRGTPCRTHPGGARIARYVVAECAQRIHATPRRNRPIIRELTGEARLKSCSATDGAGRRRRPEHASRATVAHR